jgi:hypothetical protein
MNSVILKWKPQRSSQYPTGKNNFIFILFYFIFIFKDNYGLDSSRNRRNLQIAIVFCTLLLISSACAEDANRRKRDVITIKTIEKEIRVETSGGQRSNTADEGHIEKYQRQPQFYHTKVPRPQQEAETKCKNIRFSAVFQF